MANVDELGVIPGGSQVWPAVTPDSAVFGAEPVVHLAQAEARRRGRWCDDTCTVDCGNCKGNHRGYVLYAICRRVGGPQLQLEHAPRQSRWRFWRRARWCEHCDRYRDHIADAARIAGDV